MLLFTRDEDDFADAIGALESADCMSDNRFACDYGKQFIEPHALTAAGGYNDGAQHGAEKKTPTSNVRRPILKSECSDSALGVERRALSVFFTLIAFALPS